MRVPASSMDGGSARPVTGAMGSAGGPVAGETGHATTRAAGVSGTSSWELARPEGAAFVEKFGDIHLSASARSVDDSRLNPTQAEAIRRVGLTAEKESAAARETLEQLLTSRVGLGPSELDEVLAYIRQRARITINFNPEKSVVPATPGRGTAGVTVDATRTVIDELIEDGEYLDQFVTGISGGSTSAYEGGARDGWEKTIFQGAYHEKPMIPGERPQYGALNVTGNAAGAAQSYGNSYLVLKHAVGLRSTFTPGDSSYAAASHVGTLDHFQHVLQRTAVDLKSICAAALERPELRPAGVPFSWTYLEAQIHGPLEFAKDVDAVVANKNYKGSPYEEKLRTFAEKFGVELKWHDTLTVQPD